MSDDDQRIGIHSDFPTAAHFWRSVVIPDYIVCRYETTARNIFHAAASIWHLQEWIFAEDTRGHPNLRSFTKALEQRCPELGLLRDLTDAGKHRYLNRPTVQVQSAAPTTYGIVNPSGVASTTIIATIRRKDGSRVYVSDTLIVCADFLQREFFSKEPNAEAQYQECMDIFHVVYSPTVIEKLILWINPLAGHNRILQRIDYYDVLKFRSAPNDQLSTTFAHLFAAIRSIRSSVIARKMG